MLFSITPCEHESALPPERAGKHEWLFGKSAPSAVQTKGEMLLVSEDVDLALSLRQYLLEVNINLNWTGNFWLALSSLHSQRYAGLVMDLRATSVTDRFVTDFDDEYRDASTGTRIFLSAPGTQPGIAQNLRKRGGLVLDPQFTFSALVENLQIEHK